MEINGKLDYSVIEKMEKMAKQFGPKCVQRAVRDSVNKGYTELSRNARAKYNIKTKDIKETVKKKDGMLDVNSRNLTIGSNTHFSITPKKYISQNKVNVKRRRNVTATIKKGSKKRFRHAFVVNPASLSGGPEMIWQRDGVKKERTVTRKNGKRRVKKAEGINPVRTLSVAAMASNEEIAEKTMNAMQTTLEKRLNHYAEREMKKIANH